ncbi:MAG: hypothetical protein JRI99_05815 [Deltaproteobacteria bacterium]|nr:hypothetical protein [Deltaproteobacteria bacterium]
MTLEHQVPINPLEHHLAIIVEVALAEQAERAEAREGELARQGFGPEKWTYLYIPRCGIYATLWYFCQQKKRLFQKKS